MADDPDDRARASRCSSPSAPGRWWPTPPTRSSHRVGHALGPAPLTGDEDHARRVADLTVYLRQHHAERDLARQGEQVLGDADGWRWW